MEEAKMSNQKPSEDSSRRNFLGAAAVVASAAVAAPTAANAQSKKPAAGISRKKKNGDDLTVPEFAMPPDAVPGIAQVIVDIWQQTKPNLDKITERANGVATATAITQATNAINAAYPTFKLAQVEIITEDEHDNGYRTDNENAVVLVLPNKERVKDTNDSGSLLNSAKLLMACTPNGI
jgi:hypothetical protein